MPVSRRRRALMLSSAGMPDYVCGSDCCEFTTTCIVPETCHFGTADPGAYCCESLATAGPLPVTQGVNADDSSHAVSWVAHSGGLRPDLLESRNHSLRIGLTDTAC